jgi:hypothetical protein
MKLTLPKPPPVLDSARVLGYAVLDESVIYSGHSSLFVNGKELGPVPCLAICQGSNGDGILLLHCSRDWTVLGVAEYPSVDEAKNRAERIYPGLSTHWIGLHVTKEEAAHYLDKAFGDQRCSFCGKKPEQIERLIAKNDARICDSCITEFHQMLHENSQREE